MTIPQQFIQLCILFGVILVIYLINSQDQKVVTKITLVKKYRGDNLHFSKTFRGLFPKIDFVMIFDDPMKIVDYYFNAESNILTIVAFDEKNPWSDQEYEKLHKDTWECSNVMYIPKM